MKIYLPNPIKIQINSPIIPYHQLVREILNGERKKKLTYWWLDLIETRIDKFLKENVEYDIYAVPYNYIDQPPSSLQSIEKNLTIIHKILDLEINNQNHLIYHNEKNIRNSLIEPLKNEIYEKIEEFLIVSQLVLFNEIIDFIKLSSSLNNLSKEDHSQFQNSYLELLGMKKKNNFQLNKIIYILEYIKNHQIIYDKKKFHNLEGLVQDINYIFEMKKLEQEHFKNSIIINNQMLENHNLKKNNKHSHNRQNSVSNIVPISGLILSKFHRIENELKTVLEHWTKIKNKNK